MPPPPDEHFSCLIRLLELESRREREEAARPGRKLREGEHLTGLVLREEHPGLGRRVVLTLGPRNPGQALPWTKLATGAPVFLTAAGDGAPTVFRGVLCERSEQRVRVAVAETEDGLPDDATWQIGPAGDEAGRQRQRAALDRARAARRDRLAELRDVLLGSREPAFKPEPDDPPLDSSLNASQIEAVRFALAAEDLAVVHGPPGTGKTTTLVELVRQAVRRGERVLACAPSNLAVDNLMERLLPAGVRAVRLGHPARVLETLREHTLDELVDGHADARQARKFAKEAYALFRKAGKYTRAKPEPGARQAMRREARDLLASARQMEALAAERILDRADVVCATLTGLDPEVLGERTFDRLILDEACQSTEPACWIAVGRARRVVLAGDHCQLPPTVLSPDAEAGGLGVSLMERLVARYGSAVTRRLKVQYRMHRAIMDFSAGEFYEDDLTADPSVAGHRLSDLPGTAAGPLTETAVQFLDTAGAGYDEETEPEGESRFNPQEAALVARKVRALLAAGVPAGAVAVISPYSAQVRRLRELLPEPGLEIDSIDGFQGREKEAVVLSLVRSNPEGEVGFLAEVRRMNVALTRARRKLLVVGDSATLAAHPFYRRLLGYFEQIGAYGSIWEEADD